MKVLCLTRLSLWALAASLVAWPQGSLCLRPRHSPSETFVDELLPTEPSGETFLPEDGSSFAQAQVTVDNKALKDAKESDAFHRLMAKKDQEGAQMEPEVPRMKETNISSFLEAKNSWGPLGVVDSSDPLDNGPSFAQSQIAAGKGLLTKRAKKEPTPPPMPKKAQEVLGAGQGNQGPRKKKSRPSSFLQINRIRKWWNDRKGRTKADEAPTAGRKAKRLFGFGNTGQSKKEKESSWISSGNKESDEN